MTHDISIRICRTERLVATHGEEPKLSRLLIFRLDADVKDIADKGIREKDRFGADPLQATRGGLQHRRVEVGNARLAGDIHIDVPFPISPGP